MIAASGVQSQPVIAADGMSLLVYAVCCSVKVSFLNVYKCVNTVYDERGNVHFMLVSSVHARLTMSFVLFRFRFNSIEAQRLKITKFAANRTKSIKIKYNRQQNNAIQSYSRLQCSPVF